MANSDSRFEGSYEAWVNTVGRLEDYLPGGIGEATDELTLDAVLDEPTLVAETPVGIASISLPGGEGRGRLAASRRALFACVSGLARDAGGLRLDAPVVLEPGPVGGTLVLTVGSRTYTLPGRDARGEGVAQIEGDLVARLARPRFVVGIEHLLEAARRSNVSAISLTVGDGGLVFGVESGAQCRLIPVAAEVTEGPLGRDGALLPVDRLLAFLVGLPSEPVEVLWDADAEGGPLVTLACGGRMLALRALGRPGPGAVAPALHTGGRVQLEGSGFVGALGRELDELEWSGSRSLAVTITVQGRVARVAAVGRDPLRGVEVPRVRCERVERASLNGVPLAFALPELAAAMLWIWDDPAGCSEFVALHVGGPGEPVILTQGGCRATDSTVRRVVLPRLPVLPPR
jgi:hypothetical protein